MIAKSTKIQSKAATNDFWFVRLPDGRVLRSRSTESLRQHLKTGRIPWEAHVRRKQDDAWTPLVSARDFADLIPEDDEEPEEKTAKTSDAIPAAKGNRANADMRTLGVRGLLEELFNAFDVSLQNAKLTTTAVTGLLMGVTVVFAGAALHFLPPDWAWIGYLGAGLILCVLFSACTSIVTQMTALEVSRFRPASFSEVRSGIVGSTLRLTVAFGLVGGVIGGFILLLRSLPGWLTPADPTETALWLETLLNVVNGTRLLLEVICWPILGFAMLLLGPILVIEEYPVHKGLLAWLDMLRQHLGRIYLYQALAFASAAVLTLPLVMPVVLAFSYVRGNPLTLSVGEAVPFFILIGVALTPMLSYLLVAHVFIYLNLRYEFFYSQREK